MTQIRQIFDEMRNIAFNHRMAMITFDGQAFWHKIKKLLAPYDNESFEWQPVKNDSILDLTEYTVNGRGEKTMIESNHFQIQCVHIPMTEKPCLRKLIQIALNLGQYEGTMQQHMLCDHTIESFISLEDLEALDKHILPDLLTTMRDIFEE